jgi:hypothetical protein
MEAKHTPGPWHIVDNGHWFDVVVPWKDNPDVVADYCPKICEVHYRSNDDIVGASNVNLIAAAPDLLEALQAIIPDAIGNHIGGPDTQARIDAARAAIAKATGSSA